MQNHANKSHLSWVIYYKLPKLSKYWTFYTIFIYDVSIYSPLGERDGCSRLIWTHLKSPSKESGFNIFVIFEYSYRKIFEYI